MFRALPLLIAFCLTAVAQETPTLVPEKTSPRAQRLFKKANAAWAEAKEVAAEAKRRDAKVDPERARKAMDKIEEAVLNWERGLAISFDFEANQELANAIRGYFHLAPFVPPPAPPEGEEARKKFEKTQRKAEVERLRDARRRLLDYAQHRKYKKQFQRCDRCNGRKVFGGKPCPKCNQQGTLVNKKYVIEAQWLIRSPLYRADGRNRSRIITNLRRAPFAPESVGPFVKSFSVAGKDSAGRHWVRFKTKESLVDGPKIKAAAKQEKSYTLFRVGKIWYLFTPQTDNGLIEVPEAENEGTGR